MPKNKHRERETKSTYFPMARCTAQEREDLEDLADKAGVKPTTLLYRVICDYIERRKSGGAI